VIGRRAGLASAFAAGWAARAAAQAPVQIQARIGLLSVSEHPFIQDFRDRLRELGFVEGRNLVIEYRYAQGNAALLPGLVEELVAANVALIVASGSTAVEAAAAASRNLPVVFVTSDPIVTGRTLNIARPGGFVTGVSTMSVEIAAKKVALLRDAVPKLERLALVNDGSPGGARQCEGMSAASNQLGLESKVFKMDEPAAFSPGFEAIAAQGWQAVAAVSSPLLTGSARAIAGLTLRLHLPALFDTPAFVRAGALMSYGPDLRAVFRRQADMTAHIIRGAKPADVPVEQAAAFVFAFNQTTAKAFGLSLSLPVMASVNELIE
jgi:putative ABC transport system substrate-binding protein